MKIKPLLYINMQKHSEDVIRERKYLCYEYWKNID